MIDKTLYYKSCTAVAQRRSHRRQIKAIRKLLFKAGTAAAAEEERRESVMRANITTTESAERRLNASSPSSL